MYKWNIGTDFLKSELHSNLYCLKSYNWICFPLYSIDLTNEVGLWRAPIFLQCFRLHNNGLVSVTSWKKSIFKCMPVPWIAKLTEFDILKNVLPFSMWGKDGRWQTKRAGNIKREGSSRTIWDESFLDWRILWLEKWEWGIPHAKTHVHTHKELLVFTQVVQVLSKLHELY